MNALGLLFTLAASLLLLVLPRRLAAMPLLLAAAYMTRGQELEIGPVHMTVVRLLVLVGFVRVLLRREQLARGWHVVDRWMLVWAAWLIGSSAFHTPDAWLFRAGVVWTELGCYFLLRIFLASLDDVQATLRMLCVALLPLAAMMLVEKLTRANAFTVLGGVRDLALVRNGNVRASGPFDHPILAGTVGAACAGLGLALARSDRARALAGCTGGLVMLYSAASSGPIMMAGFVFLGWAAWCVREHMRTVRRLLVAGLLGLSAVMNDPVYFVMARIDITGGSQGYFRAQLIRSSIEHLPEWWAAGTDYTRHWMPSGIHANSIHTDITNHLLAMGVGGGLGLMAVFVLVLVLSFRDVGRALRQHAAEAPARRLLVWTLGALLFGFVMMFWTISLYDQSIVFFYLVLAAIQALVERPEPQRRARPVRRRQARLVGAV
ncbi:MAG: hypothetical protein RLZZ584_2200 [Pseudomonadota bacterium]